MRSESTNALGHPKLTKPTFGVLRLTTFTVLKTPAGNVQSVLQKGHGRPTRAETDRIGRERVRRTVERLNNAMVMLGPEMAANPNLEMR